VRTEEEDEKELRVRDKRRNEKKQRGKRTTGKGRRSGKERGRIGLREKK
jgi:hypothetical protein